MRTRGRLPDGVERTLDAVLEAADLGLPARAEVEADLRAHFEDGLDAGVDADELLRRFGDPVQAGHRIACARRVASTGNSSHDGRWWMSGREWCTEARRSVRRLARAPAFAAVVVVTLALGVGANTAIFSVVNAVLLEPLPYPDADRLVRVYEKAPNDPGGGGYLRGRAIQEYRTWTDVFADFGALNVYRESGVDLTGDESTVRVTKVSVAAGFFETLGVAPELGRTFREQESLAPGEVSDDAPAGPLAAVTVLSHHLWMDHFGGDPRVVGRTILLSDAPYEVVGVMPEGFTDPFGPRAELWTALDLRTSSENSWRNYYLSAVARLPPGLTANAAQDRVDALYRRLVEQYPEADGRWVPVIVPLHADVVGPTRRVMLGVLAAAAVLVLLTACVNLANLLFAQGLGRERDVAVRAALGSGRRRIIAGLLLETGILAVVGGALGLALGWAGVVSLLTLAPDVLPQITEPRLDASVFLFALGLTAVSLAAAGLAPALRLSMVPPADVLRSDSRTATGNRRARRVRDALATAQVAAALVLVTGAGLLGRSFAELAHVPLHLDPANVLTFEVNLPTARYPDGADRAAFHRTFDERLAELPQVTSTGAVSWLPVNGRYHTWGVYWDPERPDGSNDDAWFGADVRVFSGNYFETAGIEVERGAHPSEVDLQGEDVIWVDRTAAREIFGDVDPIGQIVTVDRPQRVVGIVRDVPWNAEGDVAPTVYIAHEQDAGGRNWALTQTVKFRGDPLAAREAARGVLASMDARLVLHRPRLLDDIVARARAQNGFATALMGAFGVLALVLALVGTYGVLAGNVAGRRREFGIRMALGADRVSVRGMVLRYAAQLIVPGVALGLAGAWYAARWIRTLLFQVEPRDPVVYLTVTVLFVAVGAVAGWAPARHATRVDPARTLTDD